MRKIVALLLVLVMMAAFMSVPALAFKDPDSNPDPEKTDSGSPQPTGLQKDFTEPPAAAEETTEPTEETTVPTEETTVPTEATEPTTEATTVPTVETTVATEAAVVTEPAAKTEPDPNTVLGVSQQIIGNSTEEIPENSSESSSNTETYLLVALIAGMGAICAVLVIRRVLDV